MAHRSGAVRRCANGHAQRLFPRIAEGSRAPADRRLISDDTGTSAAGGPPLAEAAMERKKAARARSLATAREIERNYITEEWDKRRHSWASLVALQSGASEQAFGIVQEVITESQLKVDPLAWFCSAVLDRLKEHDCWSRQICHWFNKRKKRIHSLQSLQVYLAD